MNRDTVYIALVIVAFILGIFVSNSCNKAEIIPGSVVTVYDTTYRTDTIKIQKEPLTIQGKTKIVYQYDTVTLIKPAVYVFDTIVKKDTIKVRLDTYTGLIGLDIKYGLFEQPIKTSLITGTTTKYITKERPWYELPLCILVSGLGGYAVGKIK